MARQTRRQAAAPAKRNLRNRTPRSTRKRAESSDEESSSSSESANSSLNSSQQESSENEGENEEENSGGESEENSGSEQSESQSESSNEDSDPESDEEEEVEDQPPSNRRGAKPHTKSRKSDPRMGYYFVKDFDVPQMRHDESVARFKYLLSLGDLFRRFVDDKAQENPQFRALLDEASEHLHPMKPQARRGRGRGRLNRTKKASQEDVVEEEEELMDVDNISDSITSYTESPPFLRGKLRHYQIEGLNWLISLYHNHINGIFADEMGLGKTFQCISFLAYLRHVKQVNGPHLVIVPKSTVQNWAREFAQWTPEVEVLVITGNKEDRGNLIKNELLQARFDVCVTSFEVVIREKAALQKIAWQYIIVDEAHRIKNEESILSKIMRILYSRRRLLITGTPLQNNLHELWALLNFLLPDVFSDADQFDEWFTQGDDEGEEGKVVEQLRSLLSPFLIRRVKSDVEHTLLPKREINLYVGMTDMQLSWYQKLLEKDLDAVNNTTKSGAAKEGKMRLLNIVMQLRKCCNHPYLFEGAEPGPPFTTDEHLVFNSGKMIVLDKLLGRLKSQGSRVLIFSQMGRMLDILEDYCALREYEYCRIDGSTMHEDRVRAIDEYNKPGSKKFIFLLTTRAGGLGINLTTADQVVIYDSDWNPQADLQAMDRAHRIGQTKQVTVYRFVGEHAIEEKVLERAAQKLRLDQLVIQKNAIRNKEKETAASSKEELANMIRHGAQEVFDQQKGNMSLDVSIDDLISQGEERTKELNAKYNGLGLDDLQKFTFEKPAAGTQMIVNHNAKPQALMDMDDFRHQHRRVRNNVFNEELDYERAKKPPKQIFPHDYQFYPQKFMELQARELAHFRKVNDIRLTADDYSSGEEDDSEFANQEIEDAEPLTEEELKLKDELVEEGFSNFTKRDFLHFMNLLVKYGTFPPGGYFGNKAKAAKAVDAEEDEDKSKVKKEEDLKDEEKKPDLDAKSDEGSDPEEVEIEEKSPCVLLTDSQLSELCDNWPEKPRDELIRYYKVFVDRHDEVQDYEKIMAQYEASENRARKQSQRMSVLSDKIKNTFRPLINLQLPPSVTSSSTRSKYSHLNDRFLLCQMCELGLDTPNLYEMIRDNIKTSELFDGDFYFLARTSNELSRRGVSLMNSFCKEDKLHPNSKAAKSSNNGSVNSPQKGAKRKADAVSTDTKKQKQNV